MFNHKKLFNSIWFNAINQNHYISKFVYTYLLPKTDIHFNKLYWSVIEWKHKLPTEQTERYTIKFWRNFLTVVCWWIYWIAFLFIEFVGKLWFVSVGLRSMSHIIKLCRRVTISSNINHKRKSHRVASTICTNDDR